MRFVASSVLVLAGLILILWVEGSIRGVSVDTVGGVMVLLGLVSAIVILAFGAGRELARGREDGAIGLRRR